MERPEERLGAGSWVPGIMRGPPERKVTAASATARTTSGVERLPLPHRTLKRALRMGPVCQLHVACVDGADGRVGGEDLGKATEISTCGVGAAGDARPDHPCEERRGWGAGTQGHQHFSIVRDKQQPLRRSFIRNVRIAHQIMKTRCRRRNSAEWLAFAPSPPFSPAPSRISRRM